jgi:uncharacterized membrane protein
MGTSRAPRFHFLLALTFSALVSIGLFAYGAYRNHSLVYDYLIWNLFLAGLPLLLALRLTHLLQRKLWSAWEPLLFTFLWLLFLPNSFYMVSDFIHLADIPSKDILYDAVMFSSFIYLGVSLGFGSLYLVHQELKKRLQTRTAAVLIAITLLICSFAIYIGRDLRWNSWDVIFNPAGLLFDISDRFLHPEAYPGMFRTVITFFALLTSLYSVAWQSARVLRQQGALELIEKARARAQT